jgi:CHASE2 domain-containing sensor protein
MAKSHATPTARKWPGWRPIVGYIVLLGLTIALENLSRIKVGSGCEQPSGEEPAPFYDKAYTAILNWSVRPHATQVAVVAIPASLQELRDNVCTGRAYMADLLQAVAAEHPAVIMLDKFYGPTSCLSNPASTQTLIAVIRSLDVPLVVGDSPDKRKEEMDHSCLVDTPQLDLGPTVIHGVTRLVVNKEQIPLRWRLLSSGAEGNPGKITAHDEDTLALATVRVLDPDLVNERDFKEVLSADRQPYARMNLNLPVTTSSQILCNAGPAVRQRWSLQCNAAAPAQHLSGHIVVIGDQDTTDLKTVLGQPTWGFMLQAAYIDALLSGSYLFAAPLRWTLTAYAFFIIALEVVPVMAEWTVHAEGNTLLDFLGHEGKWTICWTVVFFLGTVFVSIYEHYLPPLLLLADVIVAAVMRLALLGMTVSKKSILHKKEDHHERHA